MNLHQPSATLLIPDGTPEPEALARVTHLGIGAHQDDLEFMAFHGILECFHADNRWFAGVTCTDGAGSARTGKYAAFTDEEMRQVRRTEQDNAAIVGRYAAMFQLDFSSAAIKDPADHQLEDDLEAILRATRPEIVYTHNLADKHDTHIAVTLAAIGALRRLPADQRPRQVAGCEVWRNLDWMLDSEKLVHDVTGHENLAHALNGIFDSQIAGGKRYDLAIMGRRRANATFFDSHATDEADSLSFAMDLTPLILDDAIDPAAFVLGHIDRFRDDVAARVRKFAGL